MSDKKAIVERGLPALRWQVECLLTHASRECKEPLEDALVSLARAEAIQTIPEKFAPAGYPYKEWSTAREAARRCAQFLLLLECGWSGNSAARRLDRSASWFSVNVGRYQKEGWRTFLPKQNRSTKN